MAELLLSQLANHDKIYLTVKNSRGLVKKIHIGTEVYESERFSVLVKSGCNVDKFSLERSKVGGLVLRQDPEGGLKFTITSDIKTPYTTDTLGDKISKYAEICLRDGNAYIPLE